MKMRRLRKGDGDGEETSFEDSLSRLEAIVTELEGGELPLERAIQLFEEGVALGRSCGSKLDAAERKITLLLQRADGSLEETELDPGRLAEDVAAATPQRAAGAAPQRASARRLAVEAPAAAAPRAPRLSSDGDLADDDLPF